MSFQVSMSAPDITPADVAAVQAVLETHYLSMGSQINEFEKCFAAYTGTAFAAAVNSGTSGLHLATVAAGIGPGDLAITTPFSFVASANCILYERGIPLFVDIDPQTLNIDALQVAEATQDLVRGGRAARRWLPRALQDRADDPGVLKAILAVDVFGQPADYDVLGETASRHGLAMIEDACEAVGAGYKGRRAGTLGDVAVFAFYPNKQMTTGEGGILVTDCEAWDRLFRSLRNQGRDDNGTWLNHVRLGYNYRLDEMSAALGLSQLARIEEMLERRERVAQMYSARLRRVDGVIAPVVAPTTTRASWFVYVVRLDARIDRDAVMARLHDQGVPCRPYFTPIHLQPFYVDRFGYRPGDFPVTEAVASSTLALPFHNHLVEEAVDLVCERLVEAIAQH